MPVTSTNRIPSSAARSDTRGLPNTRSGPGSNGSTTAQSSSETSHGDPLIPAPIVEITTGAPLQDRPTSSFSRLLKPALSRARGFGALESELGDRDLAHAELLHLPRDRHRELVHE